MRIFDPDEGGGPTMQSKAAWADLAQLAHRLETHPLERSGTRAWLSPKRIAAFLAVDAVVGFLGWHFLNGGSDGPAQAVTRLGAAVAHSDWGAARRDLCLLDQARYDLPTVAQFGQAAKLTVQGVDHLRVTSVGALQTFKTPTALLPYRLVRGWLDPTFGKPSSFTVTVVLDAGGWRPCLSVGGYSSEALGLSVQLGGGAAVGTPSDENAIP